MPVGLRIDALRQLPRLSPSFRQPDQLFQPGRSRRFHVHPRAGLPQGATNWSVQRKFVATGMRCIFENVAQSSMVEYAQGISPEGARINGKLVEKFTS